MSSFMTLSMILFIALSPSAHSAPGFTDQILCTGLAAATSSEQATRFVFELNSVYEESENSVFNLHKVTIEKPGLFSSAKRYNHVHLHKDCWIQDKAIHCTGIGIGIGTHEFKLSIDMDTKMATGYYEYYGVIYTFSENNSLICNF